MSKRTKQAVAIGALVATLVVGVGVGVASGGLGFGNDRQAFLNDAAKRLDVTPAELKAALQGAYSDRLDAAVAAGEITKEQADALKLRSAQDGGLPLFGPGGHHDGFDHLHHGPPSLAAAATYLGLTPAELRTELESGKSLADIAKAKGKSVEGLKQALTADAKSKLDAAVKAGKLTQAQADELEARLTEHLDDLVNGTGHARHERLGGPGWIGPPIGGREPPATFLPGIPAGSPA